MDAGRELDATIAEKVFGWTRCKQHGSECSYWFDSEGNGHNQDLFSDDLVAAWMVVERIVQLGREGKLCHPGLRDPIVKVGMSETDGRWCEIFEGSSGYVNTTVYGESINVTTSSAPLSICLAALKAVGMEIPA